MSKKFLQRKEAAAKLQKTAPANGTLFATKADCITWGADSARLAAYANTHYPVDDDIVRVAMLPSLQIAIEVESMDVPVGSTDRTSGGSVIIEYVAN